MSPETNQRIVQPVSPEGIKDIKREITPPGVFEVFNRLLGEKAIHGYASIDQKEVVKELVESGLSKNDIFKKGWLNIEPLYEDAGWEVDYYKPDYNDSGDPFFSFRAKKR